MEQVRFLSAKASRAVIKRMAYQIYEKNYEAPSFALVGIVERGSVLAEWLAEDLRNVTSKKVDCYAYRFDNSLDLNTITIQNGTCIVIDDVLYTGATLFKACAALFSLRPATLQTAVLVDRGHRLFPVAADFVGLELATTLQEYITVRIDSVGQGFEAFVS